ncbi:hypothetical protein ACFHW2_28945 [Actinomadura sp. LOL_016]|uniref:hypothetical protein n=1 Tax=unclassified Actinomadura TaxID=2626254 RepID=UPI003A801CBC
MTTSTAADAASLPGSRRTAALGAASGALIALMRARALIAAPLAPLVIAIGASAVNLGIAAGAEIGGRALAAGRAGSAPWWPPWPC